MNLKKMKHFNFMVFSPAQISKNIEKNITNIN